MKIFSTLTVFIGAFLIFQIQPILGKLMLPQFGGSASVWITSMMFFQTVLFAGYCYALALTYLENIKTQMSMHLLLLVVSFFLLPNLFSEVNTIIDNTHPRYAVVLLLWQKAGVPYFLLASSGVLTQRWLLQIKPESQEYAKHWFAWSNAGALLALCSYPFVVEAWLTLESQLRLWVRIFGLFFFLSVIFIGGGLLQGGLHQIRQQRQAFCISFYWVIYSMTGVMVLLATTSMLTQNVPPVPLLWICPLVVYLMTFIICFSRFNCYDRQYALPLLVFCCIASALMFVTGSLFAVQWQAGMYLFILFVACFICHGELSLSAPAKGTDNILYYWSISLGGCIGGITLSVLAPILFVQLLEYPLTFLMLLTTLVWQQRQLEHLFPKKTYLWGLVIIGLSGGLAWLNHLLIRDQVIAYRNFYGVVSVRDILTNEKIERRLVDGTTVHGTQIMASTEGPNYEKLLTRKHYYRDNAGIDVAFNHVQQKKSASIAVVGLGAGVLASYGRPGDDFTFYEINPAVISLSQSHFRYLRHSPAEINIVQGDARVRLHQRLVSESSKYDLLVIDAFSSDAIPVHLLTMEAFELYQKHLKPSGILAIHISSTYLDLSQVIQQNANQLKLSAALYQQPTSSEGFGSDWVLMAAPEALIQLNEQHHSEYSDTRISVVPANKPVIWTDQHHSILSLLKTW
ncbi:spermidine synthase [Rheinheimera sp.]|uniref:spermidine synthase n=1 Tax=Rheinheimera sp. TaxID=1869214 RepID=UPI002734E43E|nr:fused MFS/spermidine synthase [Rheinheimera sp.]MDP2713610.1 fused MFS/spermidine synthase [Rheinheimera sp.]